MQIRIIIDCVLCTAVCLPQFELRFFHQPSGKSKFIQRDHGRSWKFAENVLTLRQSKNLQGMGAVRMKEQTADKKSQ